jgi:hypothetical protein
VSSSEFEAEKRLGEDAVDKRARKVAVMAELLGCKSSAVHGL